MTVSYMRHASGHDYRNSSFIVDVAVGQIPRSTERISSSVTFQKIMVRSVHRGRRSGIPVSPAGFPPEWKA